MHYQTSYDITEDLLVSSVKQTFFKFYLGKKWIIIIAFFALAVCGFVFTDDASRSTDYAISSGVLAVALFMTIIWVQSYFVSLNNARSSFKLSGSGLMEVIIDGDELSITSDSGSRKVDLKNVNRVLETKVFLILIHTARQN